MAQRILGLDLGATAVKGVLIESAYRGFSLVDHAMALLPPGPGDKAARYGAAVQSLISERNMKFDIAVVAFPGVGVSTHSVSLPFSDPKRISEAIGFELEGQIPFDLAEVAWDWQTMGTRDGRTDLLVALVKKSELSSLLAALASAGVDPRAVVPAGTALSSLLLTGVTDAGQDGPGADLLLDVGEGRTNLCLAEGGVVEGARTFPFGTIQLGRALATGLSIGEADAAAIVSARCRGEEVPPELLKVSSDTRLAEILDRALMPLVREVRATLRAFRARGTQRSVRRTLLVGGAARFPGLVELLSPEVEGPVAPVEFSGAAAGLSGPAGDPYALALALALRAHLGSRAPRLNLRRGDLAYTRDFEHVRGKVFRLAAATGVVLLVGLLSSGASAFALARRETALDRALCDAQDKVLGKCYPDLDQAQAVLRGHGNPGASLPRMTAVEVFAELSTRIPDALPVRLDKIEITRDKLHLDGTTDAAENVDRIVSALAQSRCFGDARSGGVRRRGQDQKFEFSIDSGLTCLEGEPKSPGKER